MFLLMSLTVSVRLQRRALQRNISTTRARTVRATERLVEILIRLAPNIRSHRRCLWHALLRLQILIGKSTAAVILRSSTVINNSHRPSLHTMTHRDLISKIIRHLIRWIIGALLASITGVRYEPFARDLRTLWRLSAATYMNYLNAAVDLSGIITLCIARRVPFRVVVTGSLRG